MGPEEAKTHLLENFGCRVDKKSLDYFGLYSVDGASGNRKVSIQSNGYLFSFRIIKSSC